MPDALQQPPELARTLFGSGLVTGGITALVLNPVLPERAGWVREGQD